MSAPVATNTTVDTPIKQQGCLGRTHSALNRGFLLRLRQVVWVLVRLRLLRPSCLPPPLSPCAHNQFFFVAQLAGIPLGILFLAAALVMALTIIGLPIAWELLKLARFVFLPVGYKAVPSTRRGKNPLRDPKSKLAIAANLVWALFFGIPLSVVLLAACVVQLATIVGIPNALMFPRLATFVLWPIGKKVLSKRKYRANKQARRDLATAEAVRRNEAAALAAVAPHHQVA